MIDPPSGNYNNAQQQAAMNSIFTANFLSARYTAMLKPLDLSLQQLNILSILKGQPDQTATVEFIRDRMIDRMPNVSRLLNKLLEKEFVEKARDHSDQRVVSVKLLHWESPPSNRGAGCSIR